VLAKKLNIYYKRQHLKSNSHIQLTIKQVFQNLKNRSTNKPGLRLFQRFMPTIWIHRRFLMTPISSGLYYLLAFGILTAVERCVI
jgi:hypothetical protein